MNTAKNENGKPLRIDRPGDVERYLHSPEIKRLRRSLLDGEEPEVCERCFKEERSGIQSARQNYNDAYSHLIPQATSEEPLEPVYLDLRFGNLCNLACRMCNPYSSSQMVPEWNRLNPENPLPDNELQRLTKVDWFEREEVWSAIENRLNQVDLIYLTGGEPTIAAGMYRLLDLCIERGIADRITLKFNTNVTNVQKRLLDKLSHFKGVIWNLSVDAMGSLNDYIRHPSKWSAIRKNLYHLDDLAPSFPGWSLQIHTTVQMYNITRLPDLFDMIRMTFKHIEPFPYLNILDHPDYMNIRVLDEQMKKAVTEDLLCWYELNLPSYENTESVDKLIQVIAYMNGADMSHLLPTFAEKTKLLDASRGQHILSVLPEFRYLFS